MFAGLALLLLFVARNAGAQTQPAEPKPAETYQTIYLAHITQQNEANDLQTNLRNMLPKAHIYYLPSANAISLKATSDELQLAQKIIADFDRLKKTYRLTYTITDSDGGKSTGVRHFMLIVVSGERTMLKQGSRVPIVTGSYNAESSAQNTQVQYVDVGLNIDASLEGFNDGVRLHTKTEQSSVAEEKSSVGVPDPVIRQTVLEETSMLALGKPLVLGAMDVPGTTRHMEVEVVAEAVR
jgi:type II secretory pathway component GspD/PulD (secretin)